MAGRKQKEEIEDIDASGELFNLTASFSSLEEIDPMMLSKEDQVRLEKMKEQIFNAMEKFCDKL